MSRAALRKPQVGVSLFPFMAVLVCSIGTLVVLLVLVVQQARVEATERRDQQSAVPAPGSREDQRQQYEWEWKLLEGQRAQLVQDLGDQRLVLSHLEDHIRQLESKWKALSEEATQLDQLRDSSATTQQSTAAELAALTAELERARAALKAAQDEARGHKPAFAIVPYDGPHGTRRRPIYIECRADAIVLQPEGIILRPDDFEGPIGPGNVLDAALRATREYLASAGLVGTQGEPYPLLIVRPDGIEAYSRARAAMKNWDQEFGYELIDATTELRYPPRDPQLAPLLAQAVADARQRQAVLAAAMPSRYRGARSEAGFVATPNRGGFVRQPGEPTGYSQGFGTGRSKRWDTGVDSGAENSQAPPPTEVGSHGGQQQGRPDGQAGATTGTASLAMARKRGRNWALPKATETATGISRPIRVVCYPDRLVMVPERQSGQSPQEILTGADMEGAMDQFVARVHERIENWGLAVAGGYWKPRLRVAVAPGAEERFQQMTALLAGSGLDVERLTP